MHKQMKTKWRYTLEYAVNVVFLTHLRKINIEEVIFLFKSYFRYCQQIYNYCDDKNIILLISLEKPSI